jgi:phosphoenolpyruvate carboxykinase (ATP)
MGSALFALPGNRSISMIENNIVPTFGLKEMGVETSGKVYWTASTAQLTEELIKRGEGKLAHLGPVVTLTGECTGRSPNDKFIVEEETSKDHIWWKENASISEQHFDSLLSRMKFHMSDRDLFVQDCYAGADPRQRVPIRVVTESAWHSMFARNMFIQAKTDTELKNHKPVYTVLQAPDCKADPEVQGTNSPVFVVLNFKRKLILIGGTHYAGEIKKSIFSMLNYQLPENGVLPMHCAANEGHDGVVALFFGLSGTGKTSLSADPNRHLIGDDEHGWNDRGVYNFEGGCYAKVIRLSPLAEPEIYACTRRFGTILENVVLKSGSRQLDLDDSIYSENTRASYPLSHLSNVNLSGMAGHPAHVILLTCDAFGVLPPIAKLTPEQAMYHFISGYTAKVAGTEKGVKEPSAVFSACFGAPFMARRPSVYAKLLGDKIARHNVTCWLVNTGWTGGPYGVGQRIGITDTRTMVNAALDGRLDDVSTHTDPVLGVEVPDRVPGVSPELLDARSSWQDKAAFDAKASDLAKRFKANFAQFENVPPEVAAAGPKGD